VVLWSKIAKTELRIKTRDIQFCPYCGEKLGEKSQNVERT